MRKNLSRKTIGRSAQHNMNSAPAGKLAGVDRNMESFPKEMMGTQLQHENTPQPGDDSTKLFANRRFGDDWDRT